MDLNFAEFLEEYVPIMPESVQDGVLKRMTYSENLTKISFYIAFSHLVPAQDLIALEHELEIRLEIHAVRLHPRYTPELFTMTYFPDLVMFLKREMTVKEQPITLTATRGECHGTSHWVDFCWDNPEITFADILEVFGELPIPPYLNRDTQESDKETYQTVYSKIKGSVAAPTAGLHFTPRVLNALKEKGVDLEELTLHVGAGTFKPVKSAEIEGHEMHTEYISVSRGTIENLIAHNGKAIAVGTTSVRTLESLYHIGVTLLKNPNATEEELHVHQWQPYETAEETASITSVKTLQAILDYLNRHDMEALHTSTQIIIAPGYDYKIVNTMVTNFHQPQSTLLLLVSAFVKGNWRNIYDFALNHDFRFLSYGDSSLLIP